MLLESLNARFVAGHPSAELEEAGVLIHMFDDTESDEPWLPCKAPRWCAKFGDRMSASLINHRLPYVFKEGALGIILSSRTSVRCSYFADGGTMTRQCAAGSPPGCVPGCCDIYGRNDWCVEVQLDSEHVYGCAFRPKDLGMMLQHHEMRSGSFNEVIIDPTSWVGDAPEPPDAIEAFFFIRDDEPPEPLTTRNGRALLKKPRDGEKAARLVHGRFHQRYPNAAVPLVRLDLARGHLGKPFTRVA